MISCGQACPYNTLNGCKVKEYNGICPLTNMALADMEAVKDAKPKTKADHVRTMSDEELAGQFTLIAKVAVNAFADYDLPDEICDRLCSQFLEALKQPVEEEKNDA